MSVILLGRYVLHCLRACKGGRVSVVLLFCFFSLLFWATPIPYRIIMSFCFSFRSEAFHSWSFSISFLFLSLMQHFAATNRTKETRKTTRIRLLGITQPTTTHLFAFLLGQAKIEIPDHSIRYIDKYLSITKSVLYTYTITKLCRPDDLTHITLNHILHAHTHAPLTTRKLYT